MDEEDLLAMHRAARRRLDALHIHRHDRVLVGRREGLVECRRPGLADELRTRAQPVTPGPEAHGRKDIKQYVSGIGLGADGRPVVTPCSF